MGDEPSVLAKLSTHTFQGPSRVSSGDCHDFLIEVPPGYQYVYSTRERTWRQEIHYLYLPWQYYVLRRRDYDNHYTAQVTHLGGSNQKRQAQDPYSVLPLPGMYPTTSGLCTHPCSVPSTASLLECFRRALERFHCALGPDETGDVFNHFRRHLREWEALRQALGCSKEYNQNPTAENWITPWTDIRERWEETTPEDVLRLPWVPMSQRIFSFNRFEGVEGTKASIPLAEYSDEDLVS